MSVLAFLLSCAAILGVTGFLVSCLAALVSAGLDRFGGGLSAARRADLRLLMGVTPAWFALSTVLAAATPPLLAVMGVQADHCLTHLHHLHLCPVHPARLTPALAMLGAVAVAVFSFRAGLLWMRFEQMRRRLLSLERAGGERFTKGSAFPLVLVSGAPQFCHAVGVTRRRVVVSRSLREALGPEAFDAAQAHEEAHLHRRDPALLLLAAVAGLFMVPAFASRIHRRLRDDVELACDAEAAWKVSDPSRVAEALVAVAAVQSRTRRELGWAPAMAETLLERRVEALLSPATSLRTVPSRALPIGSALLGALMLVALLQSDRLHHAVETVLHGFKW